MRLKKVRSPTSHTRFPLPRVCAIRSRMGRTGSPWSSVVIWDRNRSTAHSGDPRQADRHPRGVAMVVTGEGNATVPGLTTRRSSGLACCSSQAATTSRLVIRVRTADIAGRKVMATIPPATRSRAILAVLNPENAEEATSMRSATNVRRAT